MSDYAKQPRRKFCQFCKEGTQYIDYKDTQMLRKYVTDRGKIKPRRVTGACTQHQRDIANAVKRPRDGFDALRGARHQRSRRPSQPLGARRNHESHPAPRIEGQGR